MKVKIREYRKESFKSANSNSEQPKHPKQLDVFYYPDIFLTLGYDKTNLRDNKKQTIKCSFALCSKKDNYSRKIGRKLVEERFEDKNSNFVVEIPKEVVVRFAVDIFEQFSHSSIRRLMNTSAVENITINDLSVSTLKAVVGLASMISIYDKELLSNVEMFEEVYHATAHSMGLSL